MNDQKKTPGCITVIFIWIAAAAALGLFFTAINKTGQSKGTIVFLSAVISSVLVFIILALRMAVLTGKVSKARNRQKKWDRQNGIERFMPLVHAGGLAAPQNCNASAAISPTSFTVSCAGSEFVLSIEKIRNVSYQYDVKVTHYMENNHLRGLTWLFLYGRIASVIGSSPEAKTKRAVTGKAVISYEDARGAHRTLLLRDAVANTKVCSRLVDTLQPRINQRINRVQL